MRESRDIMERPGVTADLLRIGPEGEADSLMTRNIN